MAKFVQIEDRFINLDCISRFEIRGNGLYIYMIGEKDAIPYMDERRDAVYAKLLKSLRATEKWEIPAEKQPTPSSNIATYSTND
jgi:hypothetical protein